MINFAHSKRLSYYCVTFYIKTAWSHKLSLDHNSLVPTVLKLHMKSIFFYCIFVTIALLSFSSCHHDEPDNPIKPVDERTVLVLNYNGDIFDQTGELVKQLPNCTYATEIIADGDDYFVSGVQSKGRVGYWKNGKWNTLHVDFIDDVDHWIYGIAKWDYYIFLLDIPNVLKNSGIFPLENYHDFIPADHALRVSEGKCYVIGYGFDENDEQPQYKPILYTNYKKEFLPMPEGAITGECHSIYAYDRNHTVIGGVIDRKPAVWVDKEYRIYETTNPSLNLEGDMPLGRVDAITLSNGHIYAAGWELNDKYRLVATVWHDGVPTHFLSGDSNVSSSQAVEICCYGDDVYVLTSEYNNETDEDIIHLWLNGKIIRSYPGMGASDFIVF